MASILIIGEDPASIDPKDAPPGATPERIMKGLNDARDALRGKGHQAEILLTTSAEKIATDLSSAVRNKSYDVLVIGAGLRTLAPMAEQFERLMNAIREHSPASRLAFNSRPDDSAQAAERQLVLR